MNIIRQTQMGYIYYTLLIYIFVNKSIYQDSMTPIHYL